MAKETSKFFSLGDTKILHDLLAYAIGAWAVQQGYVQRKRDYTTYAIILNQVHYWIDPYRNRQGGYQPLKARRSEDDDWRYWVYNTYADWNKQFRHLEQKSIERIFRRLRQWNFLLSYEPPDQFRNEGLWWTVNYDLLDEAFDLLDLPSEDITPNTSPDRAGSFYESRQNSRKKPPTSKEKEVGSIRSGGGIKLIGGSDQIDPGVGSIRSDPINIEEDYTETTAKTMQKRATHNVESIHPSDPTRAANGRDGWMGRKSAGSSSHHVISPEEQKRTLAMIDKYDLFWKEPDVRYKIAGKYPFTTVRLHLMRCLVKEDKRKHTGGYLYASLERPFQLVPFSEKDKGDRIYQENMTPEEVEQERWFSADAATVRHHGAERAMDAICGPGEEALSPGSAAPLPHDEARTEDAEVTVAVNEPPAPQTAEAETLWQAVRDQILLQFPNYEQVSAAVRAAWGIAVDETHDQVTLVVGMTGQRQIAFIESRLMARFDNIATHTVGRPTHIQLEARPKPPD